ncbi:GcrA family cell cycle regulator [Ochrobactrum sp. GPK 3]
MSTAAKVQLVRDSYGDGGSASVIAGRVTQACKSTVTRNAIIGLYMRRPELHKDCPFTGLKSPRPKKTNVVPSAPKPPRKKPVNVVVPPKPVAPPPVAPVEEVDVAEMKRLHKLFDEQSLRVTVMEATKNQCRYVVEETPLHRYCGHEVLKGKSWCEHHHARIFRRHWKDAV